MYVNKMNQFPTKNCAEFTDMRGLRKYIIKQKFLLIYDLNIIHIVKAHMIECNKKLWKILNKKSSNMGKNSYVMI